MICSNRKTRVFDLTRHETSIAHVSLTLVMLPLPLFEIDSRTHLTLGTGSSRAISLNGTPRKMFPSPAHYTYAHKESNDDYSYFVRWKLPTEILWSLKKSNGLTELCPPKDLLQQPRY